MIETAIPARLDRLPWSRFHWLVVIGLGAVWILDGLGLGVLLVRRNLPESPRRLYSHGHEMEADRVVGDVERSIEQATGQPLAAVESMRVMRRREAIGFFAMAGIIFAKYPRRALLCFSLFMEQALCFSITPSSLPTCSPAYCW